MRVSTLLSIGHIPSGSPPTLLSVFEKPILIFLIFSNDHGGFARTTRGRDDHPEVRLGRWESSHFLPGQGARTSRGCFRLTGRRQRIPLFGGDAQGIEPIAGIGGEREYNIRGIVAIVLVQTDFGAQKVNAAMCWKKRAVGMSWLVVNGKTSPISLGGKIDHIKKMADRPTMNNEWRSRAVIHVPPVFKGGGCSDGWGRILCEIGYEKKPGIDEFTASQSGRVLESGYGGMHRIIAGESSCVSRHLDWRQWNKVRRKDG